MAHLTRVTVVCYFTPDGQRCPKGTPGAKRKKVRTKKWYAVGVPGFPARQRVPLHTTDKTQAMRELGLLLEGGRTSRVVKESRRPLAEHLADFQKAVAAGGASEQQARQVHNRARDLFDGCGFKLVGDLVASKALEWIAERRGKPRKEGGFSARTGNFYLAAVKQFLRWMVSDGRLKENPFEHLQGVDAQTDLRHERRAFLPAELSSVLQTARASLRPFRRLLGRDRFFLYLTACGTGFRANELASLTPELFDLAADPPTVALARKRSKNRKGAEQPLPSQLAESLRGYLTGRPAGKPVWPGKWYKHAARMLRADLEDAGVPYSVQGPDGPLFADFHSLRHSYVTALEAGGVHPKLAQSLARHSDIRLTMNVYTHTDLPALAAAVNQLALPGTGDGARGPLPQLAHLSRCQVEEMAVMGWALAHLLAGGSEAVFAPLFAPDFGILQDTPGRAGTDGDETTTAPAA